MSGKNKHIDHESVCKADIIPARCETQIFFADTFKKYQNVTVL
jgi:hypothetical protein